MLLCWSNFISCKHRFVQLLESSSNHSFSISLFLFVQARSCGREYLCVCMRVCCRVRSSRLNFFPSFLWNKSRTFFFFFFSLSLPNDVPTVQQTHVQHSLSLHNKTCGQQNLANLKGSDFNRPPRRCLCCFEHVRPRRPCEKRRALKEYFVRYYQTVLIIQRKYEI